MKEWFPIDNLKRTRLGWRILAIRNHLNLDLHLESVSFNFIIINIQ
jgi:hypothetical protein